MITETIAAELHCAPWQVDAAVTMLDNGDTVPFIARYRKEKTGGLDDSQLRQLTERLRYLRELNDRKATILAAIEEQGKLTDELRALIDGCDSKSRLEDLYLPFKKRRKTKADIAREQGLEPLAHILIEQGGDPSFDFAQAAQGYVTADVPDAAAAMAGAQAIVIDELALNAAVIGPLRDLFFTNGKLVATVIDGKAGEGARFADYFDFAEAFTDMPSHRILACFRGESEGILSVVTDGYLPEEDYVAHIVQLANWQANPTSPLFSTVAKGWRTKLAVSAGLDARMRLKQFAEDGALAVFAANLHDVLLAAPAGSKVVLSIDPGYRNGCKCAVVDGTGKVLDTAIVYPHQPANRWQEAVATLASAVQRFGVELIAVGNGTASRESLKLAREVASLAGGDATPAPTVVTVSESGASVYSASSIAAEEFPDLDVSLRGAVSIARRLQDPLAELVKIDPKSIGVGQYQHDVNQTQLARTLDGVVEQAVNSVGVDINTASWPLLTKVAGVSPTIAKNIVAHREQHGPFTSRAELKNVSRLGPKAFEQCAGFCRIPGAANPLDASAVHPESYAVAENIAQTAGVELHTLVGNRQLVSTINPADFTTDTVGLATVTDIVSELEKPGRDPRPAFTTAEFRDDVTSIGDLTPGMILAGTVTNVAAFGAFVDIGVHQDGLVHVSAMKRGFVADPHDVVRSGDTVRVKVLDVDVPRKRISLTLRLDDPLPADAATAGKQSTQNRKPGRGTADRPKGSTGSGNRGNNRGGRGSSKQQSNNSGQRSSAPATSLADALRNAGFGR
ncbi:Tex family protein [Corynebacterium choanae]|uniref:S1 motif domain-containing protein n=1 Tax=Corynebacterium choanae TaxID=1862358 RepID=A0A3G6J6Y6_9CORY|nr:Tex family protein [Corynebacterium choanae]AZA13875.1 hypothetical protein CCHOA_07415 [Corynebacterium choanae]